jgi:hypothetical protein
MSPLALPAPATIQATLKLVRRQRAMAEAHRLRISPQALEYQLALIELWRCDALVRAWEWLEGGDTRSASAEFGEAEALDVMWARWMDQHAAAPQVVAA